MLHLKEYIFPKIICVLQLEQPVQRETLKSNPPFSSFPAADTEAGVTCAFTIQKCSRGKKKKIYLPVCGGFSSSTNNQLRVNLFYVYHSSINRALLSLIQMSASTDWTF